MKNVLYCLAVLALACFLALEPHHLYSISPAGAEALPGTQESNPAKSSQPGAVVPLQRAIKARGWDIPGLMKTVSVKHVQREHGVPVDYQKEELAVSPDTISDLEVYGFVTPGEVRIQIQPCAIVAVFRYRAQGKLFAYLVQLEAVRVQKDGTLIHTGANYDVYFVDENGDQQFETRVEGVDNIDIPSWVTGG